MQGFETVQQELDAKRQQLEFELQAAEGRVAEIRADLDRVHEALEALVGHKRKGRPRSRKKPSATLLDLQRHIARLREEKPFANALELKKEVRSLVRASGASLAGFPTLFAQALVSSPGFSGSSEHHPSNHALEAVPSLVADAEPREPSYDPYGAENAEPSGDAQEAQLADDAPAEHGGDEDLFTP